MTGDRAQYREVGRQVVLLVCGQCGAVVASDATTVHADWHRGTPWARDRRWIVTGAGDVPAEAVRRIYPELVSVAIDTPHSADVQGVVYAALMGAGVELAQLRGHYTDTVLTALGEAGWVLVPGPVRTEWATNRPGSGWLPCVWADEATARRMQHADTVVSRLVTDWRPAGEPA